MTGQLSRVPEGHRRDLRMTKKRAITMFLSTLSVLALMFASVTLVAAQATTSDTTANTKDQSDIEKRIKAAADVLDEVMGQKDKAIPDKIMTDADCVAVVPSMIK